MLSNIEIGKLKLTVLFNANIIDNEDINHILIRFKNKNVDSIEVIYSSGNRKTYKRTPQNLYKYIEYAKKYLGY